MMTLLLLNRLEISAMLSDKENDQDLRSEYENANMPSKDLPNSLNVFQYKQYFIQYLGYPPSLAIPARCLTKKLEAVGMTCGVDMCIALYGVKAYP